MAVAAGGWSGRTIAECAAALRQGQVTAVELLAATRAHIDRVDGGVHAFLARTDEAAQRQAEAADRRLRDDPEGAPPLCGIPVALKDVLCLEGVPTAASSRIIEGWRPPYTGTAVERLLAAGAVVVGKTNCDEFAMGSSNENSAYGPVGNPWDVERVPGGSSGGSAAAVAAGMVPFALGSDTGGSIRQPAALSGVVGFKPTYGRVSRYGLIAFASSLDQIGPFAHTVEDAATVYMAIAGHDPRDSTSLPRALDDVMPELGRGVEGMRLGLPREYLGEGLTDGVRQSVERAVDGLRAQGAVIEEVSLPSTAVGLSVYYILAPAECSSNLSRFDGVRFGRRHEAPSLLQTYLQTRDAGFGPEVKRRIMLGTHALSSGYYDAYYRRAQKVRTIIAREFAEVFQRVDALVCPTSPTTAFTMGDRDDPLSMYLCDILTIPVNLAGLPGISVPAEPVDGLPVGFQVIAPHGEDGRALRVAAAHQATTAWHTLRSPLATTSEVNN